MKPYKQKLDKISACDHQEDDGDMVLTWLHLDNDHTNNAFCMTRIQEGVNHLLVCLQCLKQLGDNHDCRNCNESQNDYLEDSSMINQRVRRSEQP